MNFRCNIAIYEEGMNLNQFIGKPMTKNNVILGEIIKAEVKGEYVEAIIELNAEGEEFLAKNFI